MLCRRCDPTNRRFRIIHARSDAPIALQFTPAGICDRCLARRLRRYSGRTVSLVKFILNANHKPTLNTSEQIAAIVVVLRELKLKSWGGFSLPSNQLLHNATVVSGPDQ